MLRIRLSRTGKKNFAQYRILVADKRRAVKGKFLERIGHYNPHTKKAVFDKDALLSWINKGAQPSNTVAKLMVRCKIKHPRVKVVLAPKRKPKVKSKESQGAVKEQPQEKAETQAVADSSKAAAEKEEDKKDVKKDLDSSANQSDNNSKGELTKK